MLIKDFASKLIIEHPGIKACYIAIVPIDGQYDLEVEVSEGDIAGTYRTEDDNLQVVQRLVDKLDICLTEAGWVVFQSRESWQELFLYRGLI